MASFPLNCCQSRCLVRSKMGAGISLRMGMEMELSEVTIGRSSLPPRSSKTRHAQSSDRPGQTDKRIKLVAFREFRNSANIEKYETFKRAEKEFQELCRKKKTESWRLYCSTLNFQTKLSDVWRMAKRFRNPRSSSGGKLWFVAGKFCRQNIPSVCSPSF
jgi:hypothetical protein